MCIRDEWDKPTTHHTRHLARKRRYFVPLYPPLQEKDAIPIMIYFAQMSMNIVKHCGYFVINRDS